MAALSMVLVASVPVLAQDDFKDLYTEEEERAMAEATGLRYVEPDRVFECGFLITSPDNSTGCEADEDGFYTTEAGVRFPVYGNDYAKNYASYIQYGGSPEGEGPLGPG